MYISCLITSGFSNRVIAGNDTYRFIIDLLHSQILPVGTVISAQLHHLIHLLNH
jgi:hypothetical protein